MTDALRIQELLLVQNGQINRLKNVITQLELKLVGLSIKNTQLRAALEEVLSLGNWGANILARTIILEALETTDCSLGEKDENT
jgi:hypothetical protein